ncbi:hypothetical protein CUN59_20075 [Cuspidothrix issatschenkoi CHARLIE-1]|uniref:Uncharacterized protein n=2 Tax=Cuspidothrix issatschenkoi TaxID=230752 RepID=A0A2S6CPC0_9CYAN|nr:hypothetical protein CUN59_20075 [Cuspidothrix issatschenkoi CHARLIE-1]
MRTWHFWINTLILSSEYHPHRFVELLMLTLAIAMLAVSIIIPDPPYIILGLSFFWSILLLSSINFYLSFQGL